MFVQDYVSSEIIRLTEIEEYEKYFLYLRLSLVTIQMPFGSGYNYFGLDRTNYMM